MSCSLCTSAVPSVPGTADAPIYTLYCCKPLHMKAAGFSRTYLSCAVLDARYEDLIFGTPAHVPVSEKSIERVGVAEEGIHRLKVYVASNDQSLNLETDESYVLIVSAPTSTLEVSRAALSTLR